MGAIGCRNADFRFLRCFAILYEFDRRSPMSICFYEHLMPLFRKFLQRKSLFLDALNLPASLRRADEVQVIRPCVDLSCAPTDREASRATRRMVFLGSSNELPTSPFPVDHAAKAKHHLSSVKRTRLVSQAEQPAIQPAVRRQLGKSSKRYTRRRRQLSGVRIARTVRSSTTDWTIPLRKIILSKSYSAS